MKKSTPIFLFLLLLLFASPSAHSKISQLKEQINKKSQEIEVIEKEIEKYQNEIDKILKEKRTLKNQISRLRKTTGKLKAEINLTQQKINNSSFIIEKLGLEIQEKNKQINNKKDSLAEIIRELNEEESQSLLEILLAHNSLSDFFANIERMEYLQKDINYGLEELRSLKTEMEKHQLEKKREKNNLETLKIRLDDKKNIAESNKRQKKNLLTKTKNKEENYRKILEEKLVKKQAFLDEIAELESQLRIVIDPGSIPSVGSGVLKWPLDKIKITQYFGNTPFATRNPQVYGGKGHNGLDFRASTGTSVKSALSGVVKGTGNTDSVRGCYSYGKWVLIKHNNGLSTLYAHLSLIKVKKGQSVTTGELIGYSGETGYATGPHLHFTVYATQGVKITKFEKSTNCKNAYIPIADPKAYLNPLSYL
jgi:murein DD-endopeptidase MepM/ murein hydrolase activator NlpD